MIDMCYLYYFILVNRDFTMVLKVSKSTTDEIVYDREFWRFPLILDKKVRIVKNQLIQKTYKK